MNDHVQDIADGEMHSPKPGKAVLSQAGILMSIAGFLSITAQVTDLFFEWARIERFLDPLKMLGGSVVLLILGNVFSRLFGSTENQRNSRSLFQGAVLVLLPVAAFVLVAIGAVVWIMWQMMEK